MQLTKIEDWGLIDYSAAVEKQLAVVDEVARASAPEITQSDSSVGVAERLIFCSHPPLVSVGRGTKPGDVFGWKGAVLETARGGRATYHGPSQIVVYPILDLNIKRSGFKARDIHGYMHALETAIVETLAEIGITARAGSDLECEGDSPSLTGVWVGDKKIASVGIGVRKGISYHGLALNVDDDPLAFQGINPCGFMTDKMTSIEKEGATFSRDDLKARLQKNLLKLLV